MTVIGTMRVHRLLRTTVSRCVAGKKTECPQPTRWTHAARKKTLTEAIASGLPSAYEPKRVEEDSGWYAWWESQGLFKPQQHHQNANQSGQCFTMILPPPNVTGTLHIGHALTNIIQDSIARWHRMIGDSVLWVPGIDHAGIATQVVVEKMLWKRNKTTRHQLGQEKFLEEIWKWKNEKEKEIYSQLKRLGSTLDWSRKAFTMDEPIAEAVREAFVKLYDEGLIVRRKSLVNWCCSLRSTISDIEVNHVEISKPTKINIPNYKEPIEVGVMTRFAYTLAEPCKDEKGEIVVATTRPETILGDVAVAVHPLDERYTHLHSQNIRHPFTGEILPIITDEFVDMKVGTGAVKVTPAHDPNDYKLALRHKLDVKEVIDETGCLINVPPEFEGLDRFTARDLVLKALDRKGLMRGSFPHPTVLPLCSRSGDIIEYRLKSQWFILCKDMAQEAIKVVDEGALEIIPNNFVKHWKDWLSSGQEWCISRQLLWGHRIPAYRVASLYGFNMAKETWVAAKSKDEALKRASSKLGVEKSKIVLVQDEDVLDTWFSSAVFPLAALGWPHDMKNFKKFYPLTLMETGHDILTFWVSRIVLLAQKLTNSLPFNLITWNRL